jgi:lipopolysaccharide export system permease protein
VLDRYLLGAFARIFGITALGAPVLFILADITARLDAYLARGMTLYEIWLLYPPQFPTYVAWTFPVAALVATVFTLQPLARHGELHAALGGGISIHRLFVPLYVGGTIAALFAVALLEVVPRLDQPVDDGRGAGSMVASVRTAFAYRTDAGELLSVQRLETGANARMVGVVLKLSSPPLTAQYLVADEATWTATAGWIFREGSLWTEQPAGAHRRAAFAERAVPTLTERPTDLLDVPSADVGTMTFDEIGRVAERLERSGVSAAYPRTKQWERLAIPLVTLVIILFAAPLAVVAGRGDGQTGPAAALVATIVYLALLRTSEGMGVAGLLPAALAACLPAIVFGVTGLILLRRART